MSKSILVIDTPEKCDGCILHGVMIGKQICNAEIKKVKDSSKKPDWCPLRDLQEKREEEKHLARKDSMGNIEAYGEAEDMLAIGFNKCIEEILQSD